MSDVSTPSSVWMARAFIAAAVAYVVAALTAAWLWSIRVPYADAWRHNARLIDEPFATGVLAADNGHPEVFANLVRWISLHALQGNEDVQIAVGLLLALATLCTLLQIVWTSEDLIPVQRAAATFAISLGIFWLGNARALLHDNDSLHVYSVLLCLALALALMRARPGRDLLPLSRTIGASAACFIASFNFGSGIATFAALFALLFIERASWQRWLIVGLGLALTVLGYRLLAGSVAAPPLQPVEQTLTALRSLAAPLIYLFWPFVDPAAAAALPPPLNGIGIVARGWTALFGDVRISVLPQTVCGALFVAVVVRSTLRARCQPSPVGSAQKLGLALAWFGIAVAALIALTRSDYFMANPAQMYAPRYLPWSSLAWAGWLAVLVAQRSRRRSMLAVVGAVGVLAASAEVGMTLIMRHHRDIASDNALAAVVGVWPAEGESGESDVRDVRAGASAMRRLEAGPFAWPEAHRLGYPAPQNARWLPVQSWETVRLLGVPEHRDWLLEAVILDPACGSERLLVVDRGSVVGLLRHVNGDHWRGVAKVDAPVEPLQVGVLDCVR